jgi:hypothetical protein
MKSYTSSSPKNTSRNRVSGNTQHSEEREKYRKQGEGVKKLREQRKREGTKGEYEYGNKIE